MIWQHEWGELYEKIVSAGGSPTHPPTIELIDECILDCMRDLHGAKNMSGHLSKLSVIQWGLWHRLTADDIDFYWDIIKRVEGKLNKWQSQHSR